MIYLKEIIKEILIQEFTQTDFNKAKTWDEIVNLFSQYKRDLTPFTKYKEEHSFLGSGKNGKVFKIENSDKVIKITKNIYDIYIADDLLGTSYKHLPKIYNVVGYEEGVKNPYSKRSKYAGVIVMEYLNELPKDLFKLFLMMFPNYNKKGFWMTDFLDGILDSNEIGQLLIELDPTIESTIKKYDFLNQLEGIKNDLNQAFDLEEISDQLDPTPGNFLMRGNTIVFTDIVQSDN
jgi:hypothetical protein